MKKIILMMAAAIAVNAASAQYVLGTKDDAPFSLMSNDLERATMLGSGALIFGDVTDPIPDKYGRKVVLASGTDLVVNNASYLFVDNTCRIVGGPKSAYSGTRATLLALKSYIQMAHPGDGSMVINSSSSELFLQPELDGVVYIGKAHASSLPSNKNSLDVDGSARADGYGANIKEVTSAYTLTNDDYTLIVNCTTAVSITLPTLAIEAGRMYNIKNIGTGTVSVPGGDNGTTLTLAPTNKGATIQLLFTAPSTYTWHVISTM